MARRLDARAPGFAAQFDALLNAKREEEEDVAQVVRGIIADVRARGDAALVELTNRFDKTSLTAATLRLPQSEIDKLLDDASRGANAIVSIDLEKQEIRGPDGGCIRFELDPFRKQCLLNGWDDIGLTLQSESKISNFEAARKMQVPWL